jgi:predicted RND superfamily exporter protein
LCCVFCGVRVAHLFGFLCCVVGGVCVAHLFSFLCCVVGGSVLAIFLVFCVVFLVGSVLINTTQKTKKMANTDPPIKYNIKIDTLLILNSHLNLSLFPKEPYSKSR